MTMDLEEFLVKHYLHWPYKSSHIKQTLSFNGSFVCVWFEGYIVNGLAYPNKCFDASIVWYVYSRHS